MKKLILGLVASLMLLAAAGCNCAGYDFVYTNYHFDRAIIKMPNGETVEVEIKTWADAGDGEQLTITSNDGTRYLVSSVNCILIEDN